MPHSVEKDFSYTFYTKTSNATLKVALTIPLKNSAHEFVARLVQQHKLPCFVEEGNYDLKG